MYELFMRIITDTLDKQFEMCQSKEQAGFRKKFSTTEHLHTVRQRAERSIEYIIKVWIVFIDFKKVFDTLKNWVVINALRNTKIDQRHIDLTKHLRYNKQNQHK